jgi:hypothetical protein
MGNTGSGGPLSLILVAPSGKAKSEVIQPLYPLPGTDVGNYIYRSESWTSKSFVTRSFNDEESPTAKGDMLPKIKDKVLITKELASPFGGHEHELAVLDGLASARTFLRSSSAASSGRG